MTVAEIEPVVHAWAEQFRALGSIDTVGSVQIFENHGAMMGREQPAPALSGLGES